MWIPCPFPPGRSAPCEWAALCSCGCGPGDSKEIGRVARHFGASTTVIDRAIRFRQLKMEVWVDHQIVLGRRVVLILDSNEELVVVRARRAALLLVRWGTAVRRWPHLHANRKRGLKPRDRERQIHAREHSEDVRSDLLETEVKS